MSEELKPCPECKGKGKSRLWCQGEYRTGYLRCWHCDGTGSEPKKPPFEWSDKVSFAFETMHIRNPPPGRDIASCDVVFPSELAGKYGTLIFKEKVKEGDRLHEKK